MDLNTHKKYFANIALNQDPSISWDPVTDASSQSTFHHYMKALNLIYQFRVDKLRNHCIEITSINELSIHKGINIILFILFLYSLFFTHVSLIILDSAICLKFKQYDYPRLAAHFNLWHEKSRGESKFIHEFYFDSNYILLYEDSPNQPNYLPHNSSQKKRLRKHSSNRQNIV